MEFQTELLRSAKRTACGLAVSLLLPGAALATADWDIVGLKLGMTEDEVRTAMQAYAADGTVIAHNTSYQYSDGVNTHRTPDFLSHLELRVTRNAIQRPLTVWFSGPAEEPRALIVARVEWGVQNMPAREGLI